MAGKATFPDPVAPSPAAVPDSTGQQLQQRRDIPMDCLGCRLTGLAFGVGAGGFLMSQLLQTPAPVGAHKVGLVASAATLFVFGLYRALA